MADMIDMKRTKAEQKARSKPTSVGQSQYPYGLSISLGHSELTKLGIDKLPQVGTKIHLAAQAHVVSVSQNTDADGESRRVDLELRKLGVTPKPSAPSPEATNKGMLGAIDKALAPADADGDGDGAADTDDDGD